MSLGELEFDLETRMVLKNGTMDRIRQILFIGAGGFIFLITLSSLYIARKTTKPIQYLLGAAERFSKQQFEPVKLNRKDELGMLAAGLNHMGIQLKDYIQYQQQFISNPLFR